MNHRCSSSTNTRTNQHTSFLWAERYVSPSKKISREFSAILRRTATEKQIKSKGKEVKKLVTSAVVLALVTECVLSAANIDHNHIQHFWLQNPVFQAILKYMKLKNMKFLFAVVIAVNAMCVASFQHSPVRARFQHTALTTLSSNSDSKAEITDTSPSPMGEEDFLGQSTMGGYTVKQRLREEVESPFRKVRLLFFASSAGSALTALYFSALNTIKAVVGGYPDAMPLDEALTSDAINIGAAIVCGFLAYRDYQAGQSNLERIARGGKLASLVVEPAAGGNRLTLAGYRRNYRVLIAAGGPDYISKLARSLAADQLKDSNIIPERLQDTDVIVVPVLLKGDGSGVINAGDTAAAWKSVEPVPEEDRNFDINRANSVIAFPKGTRAWTDYLESEIKTASTQGFDVMSKGITLLVKKNGKILRRATGLPPWGDLIGTMEVLDGSRFGMPGDSEKYGGP